MCSVTYEVWDLQSVRHVKCKSSVPPLRDIQSVEPSMKPLKSACSCTQLTHDEDSFEEEDGDYYDNEEGHNDHDDYKIKIPCHISMFDFQWELCEMLLV